MGGACSPSTSSVQASHGSRTHGQVEKVPVRHVGVHLLGGNGQSPPKWLQSQHSASLSWRKISVHSWDWQEIHSPVRHHCRSPDRPDEERSTNSSNPEQAKAFTSLKICISLSPVLKSLDFQWPFVLQTDASDWGVGAVMSQVGDDGEEHLIAFYSRKLLLREMKYSTVPKECLAIRLGVQNFRVFLLGCPFKIHRSLEWLDKLKDNSRLHDPGITAIQVHCGAGWSNGECWCSVLPSLEQACHRRRRGECLDLTLTLLIVWVLVCSRSFSLPMCLHPFHLVVSRSDWSVSFV